MMNRSFAKKLTAAVLAGAMTFSMAACVMAQAESGISDTESTEAIEILTGGWEVNSGKLSLDSNPDAKAAFQKAVEGLTGYDYEPVALLGTQTVAGTNYSILCRDKAVSPDTSPVYEIVVVYEDLDGNAEITGTKELLSGEPDMDGGYTVNDGDVSLDKNEDAKAAFDQAFEGLVGSDFEAAAYLGSQVVEGTNYLALMRVTAAVPDAMPEFELVTVYQDLSGKAEISDMETISIDADEDTVDGETEALTESE